MQPSTTTTETPVRAPDDFLVFGAPAIGEEEIAEVLASLRSGWLGTGPKVAQFEQDFRDYRRARNAVAVGSCTAALHLSMLAGNLEPGDEVITTPLTFCSTVNAIIHTGATPVLADVDPATQNIDPAAVRAKIGPKTKAILPVHFAGRACDMRALGDLKRRHDLLLIEDCAHAIETTFEGQSAGTFGDFGCFSFYVTKNVITGEGGMVLCKDPEHAARIKTLALHGMTRDAWKRFSDEGFKHYFVVECGYKSNLTDMQAALGIHQLARVEANWRRRREVWRQLSEELADTGLILPDVGRDCDRHAHHLFAVLVDPERTGVERDEFLVRMTKQGIGVGVHYLSIPEHPYYQEQFGWRPEDTPHATRIGRQTVSLPLSAALEDRDVRDVITAVKRCLG